MEEVIEAEASIIETDLSALTKSEEWLAQASERAAILAEQYKPHDIVGEADYKKSKDARSDARKDIRRIEEERKSMTDAIERAVRDFKAGARLALEPLTTIDDAYAEKIHAYEEQWRTDRKVELAQEYADMAPDLVPLVPFETLLQRYGSNRGDGWLLRGTSIEAAKDALADAVESIAEGEHNIDELVDEEDREAIKARFFQTLDLQATLAEARRAKEQRERVRRLEEERRAREEQARAMREAAERRAAEEAMAREEALRREAEEMARREAERAARSEALEAEYAGEAPGDYQPAEAVAPAQVPYERPTIIPAPQPAPDTPHAWVISIPSATRAQAQAVANWMKANGITFDRIYSGTIAEAYEREAANAR